MSQASFALRGRNPDVLTCIANLSNDEVFTPPELANKMLDSLASTWAASNGGEDIWSNPEVKFLDPFTKSGVFLREIASRLVEGLAGVFPDLDKRVDHVMTKQVYGLAITELTSLLARRSLYCSKYADGPHSVAKSFDSPMGNIWFERTEHDWVGGNQTLLVTNESGENLEVVVGGRCRYCGAAQRGYGRNEDLESHAYALIHRENPQEFISEIYGVDVRFDVIIGNPPYQLSDGGGSGTSAVPIYQHFVEQAKRLEPAFVAMVVPSRWFSGGKGLDDFRVSMLGDSKLRAIVDFPDSSAVFPGVQIKGGVSYFVWDQGWSGDVTVTTYDNGEVTSEATRPVLEPGSDVFIRDNSAVLVLRKVVETETGSYDSVLLPQDQRFSALVSTRRPFGLESTFRGSNSESPGDIKIFQAGGIAYASPNSVKQGVEFLQSWKVFIPFLASGSDSLPHPILGQPFVGEPGLACTETYLVIGPFASRNECENVISYIRTKFFRFLVLQRKPSQNATRGVYEFVPKQDFSRPWTDSDLRKKYGLTDSEVSVMDALIRPMDGSVD
jgi:site-specific DNA-methyltransferase (adenine-specific)